LFECFPFIMDFSITCVPDFMCEVGCKLWYGVHVLWLGSCNDIDFNNIVHSTFTCNFQSLKATPTKKNKTPWWPLREQYIWLHNRHPNMQRLVTCNSFQPTLYKHIFYPDIHWVRMAYIICPCFFLKINILTRWAWGVCKFEILYFICPWIYEKLIYI
jgi:hypothetical protein